MFITSQKLLAKVVGVTAQHLSCAIADRQACSKSLAEQLKKYTGIPIKKWLPTNTDRAALKTSLKAFIREQRAQQANSIGKTA